MPHQGRTWKVCRENPLSGLTPSSATHRTPLTKPDTVSCTAAVGNEMSDLIAHMGGCQPEAATAQEPAGYWSQDLPDRSASHRDRPVGEPDDDLCHPA